MPDFREIKKVMISSTSLDLPEHRAHVVEACLRQGLLPIDMKHLPARDITPLAVDQEMIDAADVYIGTYAFRYGSLAEGEEKSYTELEFERAAARGIPCLIFLMSAEHPVLPRDVETTPGAQEKLAEFKARASKGRICKEFKSAEELRSQVIDALSQWKQEQQRAADEKSAVSFHPPSNIPHAPKPYVAHPYVLLQTKSVIGRQKELHELTDWITKNEHIPADTRIFSVVAIGGMGKSALTWKWFEDIAPNELPNLAGRMWWSFYESDAHWENFIIRALAYTAGMPEAEVRQLPPPEREDRLLCLLDERPFLLVLDGLERILLAYARTDAAHLPDDDLDQQTANAVVGLPNDVRETYFEKHRLRQCTDLRAGAYLRKLVRVNASRVLLSSRLYPAELQSQTARPLPGCHALFLRGLTDDDALTLWRGYICGDCSGDSEDLLRLFRSFENYPLLLRALAGEVAEYRCNPGNFQKWRAAHPGFKPEAERHLRDSERKAHVLRYALSGLSNSQRSALRTLAMFRMPTSWDTLRALLVSKNKRCRDEGSLDIVLTELEDRGLLGWDKMANRYDIHPIVRAVVSAELSPREKRSIFGGMRRYFEAAPKPIDWKAIEKIEELTGCIELFHVLIGLRKFDEAYFVFRDHLDAAMHWRLNASRDRIELLESFFEAPSKTPNPRASKKISQDHIIQTLAVSYLVSGQPARAIRCLTPLSITAVGRDKTIYLDAICDLSLAQRQAGLLRCAENNSRLAIHFSRCEKLRVWEAVGLYVASLTFCTKWELSLASRALRRALKIFTLENDIKFQSAVNATLAEIATFSESRSEARKHCDLASELARMEGFHRGRSRLWRIEARIALLQKDLARASSLLHSALYQARSVGHVEEEIPTLIALGALHRERKEYAAAHELLREVWAPVERGPYPLWHADARNVLAQLERDLDAIDPNCGHRDAAIEAATAAYHLAWCDGPPYAYHYGLTNARQHLQELGAIEPELPPFDASKFPPMPDVELNPKDEYWVDHERMIDS